MLISKMLVCCLLLITCAVSSLLPLVIFCNRYRYFSRSYIVFGLYSEFYQLCRVLPDGRESKYKYEGTVHARYISKYAQGNINWVRTYRT